MKKIDKTHANYHLGNMKMNFLAAVVSGMENHLITPTGNIVFSRLNDQRKNDNFRNHVLDEFAKRAVDSVNNIEHEGIIDVAQSFQKRYLRAATTQIDKVERLGEDFNQQEIIANTAAAFDKVHAQLMNKL